MNTQQATVPQFSTLIENIVDLIEKGNAHVSLDDALENIPFALLGEKPGSLPYSIWQIVEHIRIAQWDILEFSRNANIYLHNGRMVIGQKNLCQNRKTHGTSVLSK